MIYYEPDKKESCIFTTLIALLIVFSVGLVISIMTVDAIEAEMDNRNIPITYIN